MQFQKDYAIVKLDRLFEDEYELTGSNGKKLLLMIAEQPERYIRNYGTLINPPVKLSHTPWGFNKVGPPIYFNSNPNEVIYLDELPITAEAGDKVYFHHNAIMAAMKDRKCILKEEKQPDGKTEYWIKVLYSDIFCSVREGLIIPSGTWTLIEPDMESWDDILVPIIETDKDGQPVMQYEKKMGEDGIMKTISRPKFLPKEKWIQKKVRPDRKLLKGFVRFVGEPLKGEPADIKSGDHIMYRTHADFEVKIEGKTYLLIKQRYIEAFLRKKEKV